MLASSSGLAIAKPLPPGLKISVKDMYLVATLNGTTVPLLDSRVDMRAGQTYTTVTSATISDDGKTLSVIGDACVDADVPLTMPLARVQARIDNDLGMALHLKQKYGDAIPHFAAAVQGDPDLPLFATNLLSAQSMGGKLDDADRTIATYAPKNLAWFAWRLAVDSDLKNVRDRPSVKAIVSKSSKLDANTMGDNIAVSLLGLVAVRERILAGWHSDYVSNSPSTIRRPASCCCAFPGSRSTTRASRRRRP